MTALEQAGLDDLVRALTADLRGTVTTPDDPKYDSARRVWNAMFDVRRPAAVLRCADEADVATAVRLLRDANVPVAVRGGGHHIAGFGTCDSGFVIDLGAMRSASPVDGGRMLVQGGATLHEVDTAGDRVGRAVPLGVVSETGVAGLALSGGVGWLTRRHGYTCDNLLAARVVTAEGEIVRASETENADLLWGLRGGGGNFGIVTEFEFRSHPLVHVVVGEAYHVVSDDRRVEDVLRFYRDWTAELTNNVTVWLAIEQVNPAYDLIADDHLGQLVVAILGCYAGDSLDDGEVALAPLTRELGPTAARLSRMRMVDLQHSQDDSAAAAQGMRSYMKGEMLTQLTDSAITGIAKYSQQMPTTNSLFEMGMVGGAMGDWDEMDAAVGLREARYLAGFSMMSADDADLDAKINWTREAWSTLTDASAGGVYLNFSGEDGEGRILRSLGANSGAKRERLFEAKRRFDPTNFFRINHNIDPTRTTNDLDGANG